MDLLIGWFAQTKAGRGEMPVETENITHALALHHDQRSTISAGHLRIGELFQQAQDCWHYLGTRCEPADAESKGISAPTYRPSITGAAGGSKIIVLGMCRISIMHIATGQNRKRPATPHVHQHRRNAVGKGCTLVGQALANAALPQRVRVTSARHGP
jgi:hypothetical protein